MIVGLHDLDGGLAPVTRRRHPACRASSQDCASSASWSCWRWDWRPPGVSAQATPIPPSGEQYTPIIQTVPSPPRWFTGSDGKIHLVYELLLTNAFAVPITVSAVDVLDAATGATVMPLTGDALLAAMPLMSVPGTPVVTLPPASVGTI